jgi:predicted RNA binding protein YcfA (HicA-like mRNA interferase family)
MKLPRDITGNDLAKALVKPGYHFTRQTGSHISFPHLKAASITSPSPPTTP